MRDRAVRSLLLPRGNQQRQRGDGRGDGDNECRVSAKVEAARVGRSDMCDDSRLEFSLLRALPDLRCAGVGLRRPNQASAGQHCRDRPQDARSRRVLRDGPDAAPWTGKAFPTAEKRSGRPRNDRQPVCLRRPDSASDAPNLGRLPTRCGRAVGDASCGYPLLNKAQ